MNQKLLNQMVALRRQGFSHGEIAEKVERSERTVRRYTRGVSPHLERPPKREAVDVLAVCARSIIHHRAHLGLDMRETDQVIKALRKALEPLDPLTTEWLATDPQARRDLLTEFLRDVRGEISAMRAIRRIEAEIGPG